MQTALICGISGQDGACLAQLLTTQQKLSSSGTSRDAQVSPFSNLVRLSTGQLNREGVKAP